MPRGELRVTYYAPDELGFNALVAHLSEQTYTPARRRRFSATYDTTYTNGPIPWHRDSGNGLLALLLVASNEPESSYHDYSYVGELITATGSFSMDPGDIVVFNSDSGHAWLSDFSCTFATVTLSKQRPKCRC